MTSSCLKAFISFLLICGLTACVNSELEVAPWNNSPIPVVYSVISPNEPAQVYLNQTFNKDIPFLKNPYPEARVFMCESNKAWVELARLSADTTIFKDTLNQLAIEKGKTYSLKVVLANTTVTAQTTIPQMQGLINNVTCEMVKSYIDSNSSMTVNGVTVQANINTLKISYSPGTDSDSGYYLSMDDNSEYGYSLTDTICQYYDFFTPKDSTSIPLKLVTVDPYLSKYIFVQSINTVTVGYSVNSPVLALIQSFGGVIPQFSNIVNGVGLFGNAVFDGKRVAIKPLNN